MIVDIHRGVDVKITFLEFGGLFIKRSITDASEKTCSDTSDGSGGRAPGMVAFGTLLITPSAASPAGDRAQAARLTHSVCYSCPRIRDACVSAGIRPRPVLARALSDQSNQGTVNRARRLVLQQRGSFPFVVFDIMQSNLICYSLMLLLVHIRPGTSLLGPVSDDIIGADLCML
jgi:hypothetical protein